MTPFIGRVCRDGGIIGENGRVGILEVAVVWGGHSQGSALRLDKTGGSRTAPTGGRGKGFGGRRTRGALAYQARFS